MEDYFMVDLPIFLPIYKKDKKYGWSKYQDNLWELLKETTDGYCMYCYDSIWINGQRRGQIEHGIEKTNSFSHLSDCLPNLGMACENCNGRYKRTGEAKRKLPFDSIAKFEQHACQKFDCKAPCEPFKKLRREYIKNGKILLQPFEAKICQNGHTLVLQYDLLKNKYFPSNHYGKYDDEELDIIQNHIRLFSLNKSERKNFEIGKFCKNVISYQSLMQGVDYNNLVVELFRQKLLHLNLDTAIKICKIIYENALHTLAT